MRREERVTVQGPVKEQQPDGMSHRGGAVEPGGSNDGMTITICSFYSFTGTDDSCQEMIALYGLYSWDTPTPVQCIVLCSVLVDWPSSTMVYALAMDSFVLLRHCFWPLVLL